MIKRLNTNMRKHLKSLLMLVHLETMDMDESQDAELFRDILEATWRKATDVERQFFTFASAEMGRRGTLSFRAFYRLLEEFDADLIGTSGKVGLIFTERKNMNCYQFDSLDDPSKTIPVMAESREEAESHLASVHDSETISRYRLAKIYKNVQIKSAKIETTEDCDMMIDLRFPF